MKRKAEGAAPPPLLVLHGDDEFAISEHVQQLRALPVFHLNVSEFDGRKAGMAEVRGVCDSLPFLSPRRLVVLHNAGGKSVEGDEPPAAKGGLVSALVDYLPQLAPFTTLVLLEPRKLPENSRLRVPLLAGLLPLAMLGARPLGYAAQRSLTTSSAMGALQIVRVTRSARAGRIRHRIQTRAAAAPGL